jgi:hypothetical protein
VGSVAGLDWLDHGIPEESETMDNDAAIGSAKTPPVLSGNREDYPAWFLCFSSFAVLNILHQAFQTVPEEALPGTEATEVE